jgi:cytochrome b pre-mRNA-processing protein 3
MLMVLHIWIVHKRLLQEGKSCLLVQEALFDELWEDTSKRIRGQGIAEISVNKYLKEVQSYSFRCCVELDNILDRLKQLSTVQSPSASTDVSTATTTAACDSVESLREEMGGVLWRQVFSANEDVDEDRVMVLVDYVRREQATLMLIDKQAFLEGRIQWGAVPTWKSSTTSPANGKASEQSSASIGSSQASRGEWRQATAPDGRTYYW